MRASRLLSLLLMLQTRGRMTAQQLAEELEVSVRTIYRDMDALAESGVPVYADRGPDGGYSLLEGYRTRLTGMTAEEADALALAGMPEAAAELGLSRVLAAAQLKVSAALPSTVRKKLLAARARCLTPHKWSLCAACDPRWLSFGAHWLALKPRAWPGPPASFTVCRPTPTSWAAPTRCGARCRHWSSARWRWYGARRASGSPPWPSR